MTMAQQWLDEHPTLAIGFPPECRAHLVTEHGLRHERYLYVQDVLGTIEWLSVFCNWPPGIRTLADFFAWRMEGLWAPEVWTFPDGSGVVLSGVAIFHLDHAGYVGVDRLCPRDRVAEDREIQIALLSHSDTRIRELAILGLRAATATHSRGY